MIDFNIKRILVPVDFNPPSINALESAISMARRHNATILLMNVVEASGLSGMQGADAGETALAMTHHAEQELLALQHSVIERFLVSCEVICTNGIVSSAILRTSVSHRADIIVMGTHGSSGFRESIIGLNAFNVVKGANCPVLTIPPEKKWQSFKKILFPVRPIPAALEKYDFIRKMIRKEDATLKILGLVSDYEQDVDLLKELAHQLQEKLKEDNVEATTYFKVGSNMAEEVLKIASLMETDLIVITANIDSSDKQLFVGPYTQHILNHSHFPVLSVKPVEAGLQKSEALYQNNGSFAEKMQLYN